MKRFEIGNIYHGWVDLAFRGINILGEEETLYATISYLDDPLKIFLEIIDFITRENNIIGFSELRFDLDMEGSYLYIIVDSDLNLSVTCSGDTGNNSRLYIDSEDLPKEIFQELLKNLEVLIKFPAFIVDPREECYTEEDEIENKKHEEKVLRKINILKERLELN